MSTHLEELVEGARAVMRERMREIGPGELRERAEAVPSPRPFRQALIDAQVRGAPVIAEIKRASPSKGNIAPNLHPASLAQAYERGGAACLSVLTEPKKFLGSLDDLVAARMATKLPTLRKDFLVEPYQLLEARVHGADAVLLIAAALSPLQLYELAGLARELGMAVLLEIHDEAELKAAQHAKPDLLGINNRDLKTLEVHKDTFARLAPLAWPIAPLVAESGMKTPADVKAALAAGASAVLIGEALSASPDAEIELRGFVEAGR